jgi:hypothetical protein
MYEYKQFWHILKVLLCSKHLTFEKTFVIIIILDFESLFFKEKLDISKNMGKI